MLLFDGIVGIALLVLWVFCIFDVVTTDESQCRNLPKLVWLLIVLILPDIGSIIWLVAGRPHTVTLPTSGRTPGFPEYERPGRFSATNPDDDEEFLRRCRERAEEQRRTAREQQRRAEDRPDDDTP